MDFWRYAAHRVVGASVVAGKKAVQGYAAVKDYFAHGFYLFIHYGQS